MGSDGLGVGGVCTTGATVQALSMPTIATIKKKRVRCGLTVKKRGFCMGVILLEALLALCIFIAIVWWTMFSGRNKGELPHAHDAAAEPDNAASPSAHQVVASEDKKP
jgi:hypothetical protein